MRAPLKSFWNANCCARIFFVREQKSSEKIRTKFSGENLHVWGVLPALYEVSAEYNSLTPSFCSGWRFSPIADRFLSWFPRDCRILKWGNPKFSLRGRNGIRITNYFFRLRNQRFRCAARIQSKWNYQVSKFAEISKYSSLKIKRFPPCSGHLKKDGFAISVSDPT